MKKIPLILATLLFSFAAFRVSAHELLPEELTRYLAEHPNATAEEIRLYADRVFQEREQLRGSAETAITLRAENAPAAESAGAFFTLGFRHILEGADHVLFIISLLLIVSSVRQIFALTAAFTLAHSITLLLAGSKIIVLPPRIVEPIIALSIVYVALLALFNFRHTGAQFRRREIPLVFLFGLFHGLGFAGLLEEVSVPENSFVSALAFFNIGIEAGQLLIVSCALPVMYAFRKKSWYPEAEKAAAFAVAVLGIYWVVERIAG